MSLTPSSSHNSSKVGCWSAPGKALLLGEYAVLAGHWSLVAAVNRFAYLNLTDRNGPATISSQLFDINDHPFSFDKDGNAVFDPPLSEEKSRSLSFTIDLIAASITNAGQSLSEFAGADINLNTDDFFIRSLNAKIGLGSSAALAAIFGRAFLDRFGQNFSEIGLLKAVHNIHHKAQGKIGSGVDAAASCFGGCLAYRTSTNKSFPEVEQLEWPSGLHVQFVWSGESASTRQLVNIVNTWQSNSPAEYEIQMEKMGECAREGIDAFRGKRIAEFLGIVEQYGYLMHRLGELAGCDIYSDVHRQIHSISRQQDCSYKPSGAGGGDIGVCFSNSKSKLADCLLALETAGFDQLDLALSPSGVTKVS